MPLLLPTSVDVVQLEVSPCNMPLTLLTYKCPVWGVIWLIQATIFFALGIIVGLVAFKVRQPLQ